MLTTKDTEGMTKLEALQAETLDYLTGIQNNQVRGFYEFDGYWKRKDEALEKLGQERKDHLPELFDYMTSLSISQIVVATRAEGLRWLHKYGRVGQPGRPSDNQKYSQQQAYAGPDTTFVKENWGILQRVRFHIGAVLNKLTRSEVECHVRNIARSELNSTFWNDEDARFSNALFRLEICKTWLDGTDYQAIVDAKLSEVSLAWLGYAGVKIDTLTDSNTTYIKRMQDLRNIGEQIDRERQTAKERLGILRDRETELRKDIREANIEIGTINLNLALKLKGYADQGNQ